MTYQTLHTEYGLQRMAAAEAASVSINLTHMAVGDGNGNAVTPTESMTQLVRERYRATVNRVFQDPENPKKFTAELIVPSTEGGFTLREVGIFDSDGGLFAVGNLPETYKPNSSEGAYSDTAVRIEFLVTNAGVVTIQIDPNVAVATQTWISNNITAGFLLPGGTTHQVLRKVSNTDGHTEWADPTDANVVVNTIEEQQTLSGSQTQVDLALTTVIGLAIYIAGVRIPKIAGVDGWQPHATIATRLTLGKTYTAGTRLTAVQNEPAGNLPDPLDQSQNLADVEDTAVARTNLDVYSKAEVDARARQPGDVIYTARSTQPARSLRCNGAAVSRTAYAALFAAIGTTFGAGDGFNTFNVPDARGEFLRGHDDGRGVDSGRVRGSWQGDQNREHTHDVSWLSGDNNNDYDPRPAASSAGNHGQFSVTTSSSGGSEARPRNLALLAYIVY